ncbi:MAG: Uncharacterised protein [Euryarchaeota archaeon UBA443]|nr:MAG: Uncharacterised protein [Euryarchaeota archaeon UBA443]
MQSHRFSAFLAHAIAWVFLVPIAVYFDKSIFILYLAPLIILDLWFTLCLGFMLRLPKRRNDQPLPSEWEWEEYDVLGYPVRWLSKTIDIDKPLAILIHGWNSRALNMTGRSDLYEKLGYNCILFEMRAHGGNKRVPNWAALHVCHDLESVLNVFEERGWLKNGFIIHGHSLGGFVAQRVMRNELQTSDKALGMVLESPVTSYEYINNQTCEFLKIPAFLHKAMMHRLLNYYNRLNLPIFTVESVEELITPHWGFPSCPTLLVQAKNDATLGTIHADLLIDVHSKNESDFTYHIVEELKHSHEKNNSSRDRLIEEWMEEKSLFFV